MKFVVIGFIWLYMSVMCVVNATTVYQLRTEIEVASHRNWEEEWGTKFKELIK